ncbi:fungal specific transcription factor domain-containing protein [Aspergillus saccharolyticus JOP 1030-1]|uniref:Xylanolytic transcriptional activator regulatory domain-containing protein n=1 Tax=Aspergillus saccharolyticus JOP 1030-1 TaxID=1450539 RepID=A0A318ZFZ8_9EURO|nr:hypothetical protein BP01DRAFT_294233 [Aspergillus saccharolyticus JOP 1030-1]PYH46369.1 hypothetical protein BP01DRAFT_294233 [Aspergillus saccharolyticus JOP 1030-1]
MYSTLLSYVPLEFVLTAPSEALIGRLYERYHDVDNRLVALELKQFAVVEPEPDQHHSSVTSGLVFGESSLTTQSLQGTDSAQIAAQSAPTGGDPAVQHAFEHLRRSLDGSHGLSRQNFYFSKSGSRSTLPVERLPATFVNAVLQRMKVRRPIFLTSYALNDLLLFEDLCQKVYSPTSQSSAGQIASTHGVLIFVLKEYIAINDELRERFDLATHLAHCEEIFVAALEAYDVLLVPSFENILALTMGMIKAQGEAKLSLYWTLVSAAATQCQSLGYHREATYRNIPSGQADSIRRLFWTLYTFDKNISLLLGRVSSMQGLAIDTRYPAIATERALRPWDESFVMGIRLAELQNRVFTGLYSPATAVMDSTQRARLIDDLAAAMEQWRVEFKQINPDAANHPPVFHLSRGNWDISFYSTLTLLFRASSSTETGLHIDSRCFTAARNSLQAHLQCFPQYQESRLLSDGEYINWYDPLLLILQPLPRHLHAIAAKDPDSVALLAQVVDTLKNLRDTSSQGAGSQRLYQICATFAQLAQKLVESVPSVSVGTYNQEDDSLRLSDAGDLAAFPFQPNTLQDLVAIDDVNRVTSTYATDFLNEWITGQPFLWNRFDFDFGEKRF